MGGGSGARARSTLSVLHEFVPNQGDGWQWVLQQLADAALQTVPAAFTVVKEWLRALAGRTAEMHRAFAVPTADLAFQPEPVSREDLADWKNAARAMADSGMGRAHVTVLQRGSGTAGTRGPGCCSSGPPWKRGSTSWTAIAPVFSRTRHHGDFHLGQVLVAGSDAVIVDFEGEPLRPLQQRRAKHAVLRDLAGMLRSLSYAAETAKKALPAALSAPARQAALERLDELAGGGGAGICRHLFLGRCRLAERAGGAG